MLPSIMNPTLRRRNRNMFGHSQDEIFMEKMTARDPMCTIPGGLPQTTPEIWKGLKSKLEILHMQV